MTVSLARLLAALALAAAIAGCRRATDAPPAPIVPPVSGTVVVAGVSAPVRIVRDRWGVPHVSAATTDDLFFAQGFVQAEDRLFQMDLWHRSVQGRLAEVLGPNFISRDAMTRRIQYRGSLDDEWMRYGAETRAIASAFVRGVNAWVAIARERPPEEFALAGWRPDFWRPEDLLNRTDAFLASGDALEEVFRARLIAAVGIARATAMLGPDAPARVTDGLDVRVIGAYLADAIRQVGPPPVFSALMAPLAQAPPPGARGTPGQGSAANPSARDAALDGREAERGDAGAAWAIEGRRSADDSPVVATDVGGLLTVPSRRYLVHLTAPGWNVIGATAPWLPGVVVGHNDRMAWGMTPLDVDTTDLFVERLNPVNRHQVEDQGQWRNTTVVTERLLSKGHAEPIPTDREYTPHGVVVATDSVNHLAFVLRWSGTEPGAAGHLAALDFDRASSADDFRLALRKWTMPAAEVVFAERGGAVGSQTAALVPIRRGHDGRLPVPAWNGGSLWDGWSQTVDGAGGRVPAGIVVAGLNRGRTERVRARLARPGVVSLDEAMGLERDTVAWNAGQLVPLLARLRAGRGDVEQVRLRLLAWNRDLSPDSADAAIYVAWERIQKRMVAEARVPRELADESAARLNDRLVAALVHPSSAWFDGDAVRSRDALMLRALGAAVDDVAHRVPEGGRPSGALNQLTFHHPLAVTEAARRRFDVGPFPRGGYAGSGASFSAIFDTADWDRSVVQNAPGQSESPGGAHFADLARLWAAGQYFPLAFSDEAVRAATDTTLTLVPQPPSPQRSK